MGFKYYAIKRFLETIVVVFSVITINFILVHLAPGDIALYLAGREATPEFIEAVRERYGLNKPLYEQYVLYVTQLIRGDLGYSWRNQAPVLTLILNKIPNSLLLLGTCAIITIGIGVFFGTVSARRYPGKIDSFILYGSLLLYSLPIFWFGLIMLLLFALNLRLFPMSGMYTIGASMSPVQRFLDILWHLFLPATSLSIIWFGSYVRITRSSILEIIKEDYITTSKAIGYEKGTIFYRHALRNALLPVVTMAGLQIGLILSGSVLTETIFAWPGMGRLVYEAVLARDYPLIIGCYTVISIFASIAVFITDLIYAILDPRIRYW